MTDLLNSHEMASLNRALARRTGDRVRVGPEPISVAQGIVLWNAAAAFEEATASGSRLAARTRQRQARPAIVRDSASIRRVFGGGAILVATASLGACTSLGGNVQGNFSCRAPDGICAPTSTIDDAALALIGGDDSVIPAGPYSVPAPESPRMIQAASNGPVRSGEKVLRIVFPSHIDAAGRYRETTAIHAVVERAVWTTASTSPLSRTSAMVPEGPPQQFADSAIRSLGDLASAAPEVRFPDPVAAIDALNAAQVSLVAPTGQAAVAAEAKPVRVSRISSKSHVSGGLAAGSTPGSSTPGTATMAALSYSLPPQAAGGTPNPIESIRAQVAQRLRSAAPPVPGPPSATVQGVAPQVEASGETASADVANRPALFPVSGVNP